MPPRVGPVGDAAREAHNGLVMRHLTAVLKDRGEGDDIDNVAVALRRAGLLERLLKCSRFQPLIKKLIQDAVAQVMCHWTARHAVHVWDRLELSRDQMETLRHLLSYVYDGQTDT